MVAAAAVLFLLALGMTLYPVISNYVNEKYASEIHTAYEEVVQQADNSALIEAKALAIAYNEAITPGAAEDTYSQAALMEASVDYDSQLNIAGNGIMGYVEIPKIHVNLPIYHGTGNDALERGVGHLLGSSLPVGGESTHSILTGHSGMASQKMFTDLEQMSIGDVFYLHVLNETLAYQVAELNVVLPHDTSLLGITHGEDYCTLVTCTPYAVNILGDYGLENEVFGTISIPAMDLNMPIFLGATDQHMADGVGHMSQTSLPIGGENTNCVIAGHRGYSGASYFRYIEKLQIGDTVTITNLWETLDYCVVQIKIIYPNEVEEILIQPGRELLTLLTCHPYASGGKQRYLVICERAS